VPFPPGGSTDFIARAIGPSLTKTFGQTFIVDNKAGATGTIGAAAVKRAAPDGYTFLVTSLGPLVIAPHLVKGMQYDALKDFDLITVAVQAPNVLVVPAGLAAQVARRRRSRTRRRTRTR
jgi:tripartite-type tricarboxylate transporter receptor subunit TctC